MATLSLNLEDGNIIYEFNPEAIYQTDGKSYSFISFKKTTSYMKRDGNRHVKYQNLTVKPAHRRVFIEWLQECLDVLIAMEDDVRESDGEIPF